VLYEVLAFVRHEKRIVANRFSPPSRFVRVSESLIPRNT